MGILCRIVQSSSTHHDVFLIQSPLNLDSFDNALTFRQPDGLGMLYGMEPYQRPKR